MYDYSLLLILWDSCFSAGRDRGAIETRLDNTSLDLSTPPTSLIVLAKDEAIRPENLALFHDCIQQYHLVPRTSAALVPPKNLIRLVSGKSPNK